MTFTEQDGIAMMLLTHVLEVQDSNLGLVTGYPD
jgi:hypothetical protein